MYDFFRTPCELFLNDKIFRDFFGNFSRIQTGFCERSTSVAAWLFSPGGPAAKLRSS